MSTLKPRTATIPIYQGDDAERLAELRMAVAIAERQAQQSNGPRRIGELAPNEDVKAARAAYDAFVDEAAERAVEVVVRSIGRRRFRELVAAHPARSEKNDKGEDVTHDDDLEYGVDMTSFPDALLAYSDDDDVKTVIEPEFTAKSLREFLEDEIADGDYDKLFAAAYWINRAIGSDPKELRYSPSTNGTSG